MIAQLKTIEESIKTEQLKLDQLLEKKGEYYLYVSAYSTVKEANKATAEAAKDVRSTLLTLKGLRADILEMKEMVKEAA